MSIERMNRGLARAISIVSVVGPSVLLYLIGSMGSTTIGLYAIVLWTGVYIAWNVSIVKQQEWQVVERLGQFYEVKLRGLRFYCMLGLIDTIKAEGNLLERKKEIFEKVSLDFKDGSAPVEAYMWYKNGRPNGTKIEIKEDVASYAYVNQNPEARAIQIVEDRLRPRLQGMSIDTASETRADIVNGSKDAIALELEAYGLYFSKNPPIVIIDIMLSEEMRGLRQQRLRGKTTADEIENESAGYRRGVEAIMYRTNPDGTRDTVYDLETATNIWREQQTRKMFAQTGSNITIITDSADKVVKTLNVTKKES